MATRVLVKAISACPAVSRRGTSRSTMAIGRIRSRVWPDHADRAYVAYIDGGAMIFDISGLAAVKAGTPKTFTPRLIGRADFHPPFPAWTHTFQPMFARKLAWASDEDVQDNCKDAPKLVWLLDIQDETHPVIIGTAPLHANDGELCTRGGRFGAHNLHPNFPGPLYKRLENTTVASWFNGGVRIFRAAEGPKASRARLRTSRRSAITSRRRRPRIRAARSQINHAIVDEKGLIYANVVSPAGSTFFGTPAQCQWISKREFLNAESQGSQRLRRDGLASMES